jgi:adenylate kinase family enzyme
MKIAVIGYSGSGKSTLAAAFGEKYSIEVLHLDCVHFLPGWEIRPKEEKEEAVQSFLDYHTEWVIDGNYTKLSFERRMKEADMIVFLNFNRFDCFFRAYGRYLKFHGRSRRSIAEGCNEKFDFEFAKWILWKGRTKAARARYADLARRYPEKFITIKNQRELERFYAENSLSADLVSG